MARLNQIISIAKTRKVQAQAAWGEVFKNVQKAPLLSGITRTYVPKDDDGDVLPSESTRVQLTVQSALDSFEGAVSEMFDTVAQLDDANTRARADVVVDGVVLISDVPVTTLMFLEKQLVDVATFVSKLPLLDPAETWELDPTTGVYKSATLQTTRTKKVPKNHVKAPATDKFPAQVEMFTEDVIVGTWNTIKFSGAIPAPGRAVLLSRVAKLRDAVKFARESANLTEVYDDVRIAPAVFNYLLR